MEGGPPSATTRQKSPVLIGLKLNFEYAVGTQVRKCLQFQLCIGQFWLLTSSRADPRGIFFKGAKSHSPGKKGCKTPAPGAEQD